MKTQFFYWLSAFMLFYSVTQAQDQPAKPNQENKREKMEALRVGFITQELELSPTEAEKFWPIFNQYQNEQKQLRESYVGKKDGGDDEISADKQLEFEQKRLDLRKKYHAQFKTVLGEQKLSKLYDSERRFRERALQQLKKRREMRDPNTVPRKPRHNPAPR